jgi:hypothetical protein
MVLSKQNTGKYLTKEWNEPDRERQRCLYDMRNFSPEECAYYEVYGTGINDGLGYQLDDAMIMDNSPVDIRTNPRRIDHRDKPEVGH